MSIKPEYAEKILNGSKRFEYRKSIFRDPRVKTVVMYATLPVGKVIGQFDVAELVAGHPVQLWRKTRSAAGISRSFFMSYFSGRCKAHAIRISKPKRYDIPMNLFDVAGFRIPPQSFRYLRSC